MSIDTLDTLVAHLHAGEQITNGPQNICAEPPGFRLRCMDPGCCDDYIETEEELREYLEEFGDRRRV